MSPKPIFSHSTRVRGHYEDDKNLTFIVDDVQEPSGEHSRVQVIYLDPAPVSEVPGFCQRSVALYYQLLINVKLIQLSFPVTDRERVKQHDNARPRKRKKKHSL